MATDLCKTDLGTGSGAARYPLLADGKDLLIVKHPKAWLGTGGGKNMIVTPDKEYFSQAVVWGEQDSSSADSEMFANNADAAAMQGQLLNLRNDKTAGIYGGSGTANCWVQGHRPLFAYWARSYPPYRIKADPNINGVTLGTTMELGASWKLLRFNFRALPVGLPTIHHAYWRIWNPSCLYVKDTPLKPYAVEAYTYLHSGAGVMRYKFSSEIHTPKWHESSGYGEADIAGVANEGRGGGWTDDVNDARWMKYDIWDSHNGVAAPAARNFYGQERLRIYAKNGFGGTPTADPYFADVEITGNGLTSLKNALKDRAPIWAHCGFPVADAQSAGTFNNVYMDGQVPRSTLFVYCSRLELRIDVTWTLFYAT